MSYNLSLVTWQLSYKKQELFTLPVHLGSPTFFVGFFPLLLIFLVFRVMWGFFCLRHASCVAFVTSVSGLFVLHSSLPLQFSLMSIPFILDLPILCKTIKYINRTTALGVYSVVIPKDCAGSLVSIGKETKVKKIRHIHLIYLNFVL